MVEVDDECLVFGTQHLVKEAVAGAAFFAENPALAHAGVDQQTEREREIRFAAEVLDGLRAPIFLQGEVIFAQVIDDLAVLVAHRGKHVHDFHVDSDGVLLPVDRLPTK